MATIEGNGTATEGKGGMSAPIDAVLALEKTPAGTTAAALEVDPVLAAAVADALP